MGFLFDIIDWFTDTLARHDTIDAEFEGQTDLKDIPMREIDKRWDNYAGDFPEDDNTPVGKRVY